MTISTGIGIPNKALKLRLTGSSRARAATDHAAAYDQLPRAETRERAAHRRRGELNRSAAAPNAPSGRLLQPGQTRGYWHPGAVTRELADLTRRWDQCLADAIARDLATAHHRGTEKAYGRAYAARLASLGYPGATTNTHDATRHLAAVHAEPTLRTTLPPRHADQETAERVAHHTQQTAQQAALQATRTGRHHTPYRPPHTHPQPRPRARPRPRTRSGTI